MPTIKEVRRPWVAERDRSKGQGRQRPNREIYDSTRWRKLRKMIITREPFCRTCKQMDVLMAAKIIDHIVPINKGGDPWDEGNLQPLCKKCHDVKTAQERWGR